MKNRLSKREFILLPGGAAADRRFRRSLSPTRFKFTQRSDLNESNYNESFEDFGAEEVVSGDCVEEPPNMVEAVVAKPLRRSERRKSKYMTVFYLLIFNLGIVTIPSIDIDQITRRNESNSKRAKKSTLLKSWLLRKHVGRIYCQIEDHFKLRRPLINVETDSNISALRFFLTFITNVSMIKFIF